MTTLIVGAGLVGSQVAHILQSQGERPVLMDYAPQPAALADIVDLGRATLVPGDVLRPLLLAQILREHKITAIVHTAANPNLTLGAQRDPYQAVQLNIVGTMNVMEAARIHDISRVVVSSSNVLSHFMAPGDGSFDVMREEGLPRPTTFYASTKQAIENLGLSYARWYGLEFAAMRYGAVFGPWRGQGGGGPSGVMRDAIAAALKGEEALLPTGAVEWVYSKDAAQGTVQALQAKDLGSRVFNITMGTLSSPADTKAAFAAVFPTAKTRTEVASAKAVSLPDMVGATDLSLARRVLGYAPKYDLRAGIKEMAEWMRARGV
ncbi:MAG: NAD-dependent epimerase/dehydratase family protein [Alphaproteobacteria bacterium]